MEAAMEDFENIRGFKDGAEIGTDVRSKLKGINHKVIIGSS
jgi:hypothetical protein